jgi:hypothetical protein
MKRPRRKDDAHLEFIRELPCLVTGTTVGVDAAHIRAASIQWGKRPTGMGERPADMWTVPLSRAEHEMQHSMSERAYWCLRQIDPLPVAAALYIHSGDHEVAEDILNWWRGKGGV